MNQKKPLHYAAISQRIKTFMSFSVRLANLQISADLSSQWDESTVHITSALQLTLPASRPSGPVRCLVRPQPHTIFSRITLNKCTLADYFFFLFAAMRYTVRAEICKKILCICLRHTAWKTWYSNNDKS